MDGIGTIVGRLRGAAGALPAGAPSPADPASADPEIEELARRLAGQAREIDALVRTAAVAEALRLASPRLAALVRICSRGLG
jgi:hypothetical protein